MGNSVSQVNQSDIMQNGNGFSNNFNDLQNTIQQMVKKLNNNSTYSETINLHDSTSDIDFDSVQEIKQSGGIADILNVTPRRIRYGNVPVLPQSSHTGGSNSGKLGELESINDKDLEVLKNILSRNNNQAGGCGCSGDATDKIVSDTSPQPVDYNILTGGKKKKDDDSEETEDEEDVESEDEEEETDEDIEEEEEEDEDEEDEDEEEENSEESLARVRKSSSSSNSSSSRSSSNKKLKRAKRHNDSEYLKTSQSGGSEEIIIDSKYLYSDNNSFYGSDDNSEYYKAIKNRSVV